jgi:thioesterase domain-containing protein
VEEVGLDDEFFALGGESLHAAELFGALETDLPGTTLLWAPTVKRLAAALEGEPREDLGRNLVPVEAGGNGPPVFLVHTHGGEALPFVRLVRRMTADQSFYAFARDDGVPDDVSVEGLAADYVDQVRAFQPEGPYFIVGVCFGAGVALEMGRLLLAEGQTLSLLALVLPIGEPRSRLRHYARRLRFYAGQRRVLWAIRRAIRIHTRNLFARVTPQADPVREGYLRTMAAAGGRYVATPYAARVAVFRGPGYATPDAFWERLAAGGVDWYEIDQDANNDVFNPRSVELLATRLDEALERATASGGGGIRTHEAR